MPTLQPYFLNGASLSDATAVYTNSSLSIYAPNGWYSEGTIIREQIDGVLQPVQPCPACGNPCGEAISGSGGTGVYKMNIDTGETASDVGAIIVVFNPQNIPDGIKVVFNGVTYNEVSSEVYGWLGGVPAALPIFLGRIASQASCPAGSVIGGPFTLSTFEWDGTAFIPTGMTESVTVSASQDRITVDGPSFCTMVIPKPSPVSSTVDITCYGVCSSTGFNISVSCPTLLKKFKATVPVSEDPTLACELPINQNYYVANVNGAYPYIGLYDWVFLDPYGINKAPDGYYRTNNVIAPNDTIRIANGVIDEIISACP
jgi:hypothetical protein